MNKCFLDCNVLVYFKDESSPYHQKTVEVIKKLINENVSFSVSPLVLDEFIYVLRQSEKLSFSLLRKTLQELFVLPDLSVINPPDDNHSQIKIIDFMERYSLRPRDAYHLLTMLYNKIGSFFTFDNDFKKVFSEQIIFSVS